jgi:LmbE family N-acetylglucosaminyl deacetylase
MALAQENKVRIIAFGAHPDDCDVRFAGTAAKFAAMGYAVKFVSVTNGDAGHHSEGGGALAKRRRAEAAEAGRRLGIAESITLDNHDGELMPALEVREQIIRLIRQWNAGLVLAPRPVDYHPDHRYTGVMVQDAAFLATVPNICRDTPPLRASPVFLCLEDQFQKPFPFRPDIAIDVDDVWAKKINALDAHESQMYEWLPWHQGVLDQVPRDPVKRKTQIMLSLHHAAGITPAVREALVKLYGPERGQRIQHAEAFELCEYGAQPSPEALRKLFPMIP